MIKRPTEKQQGGINSGHIEQNGGQRTATVGAHRSTGSTGTKANKGALKAKLKVALKGALNFSGQ